MQCRWAFASGISSSRMQVSFTSPLFLEKAGLQLQDWCPYWLTSQCSSVAHDDSRLADWHLCCQSLTCQSVMALQACLLPSWQQLHGGQSPTLSRTCLRIMHATRRQPWMMRPLSDACCAGAVCDGSTRPLLKLCDFGYSKSRMNSLPKSNVGTLGYAGTKCQYAMHQAQQ